MKRNPIRAPWRLGVMTAAAVVTLGAASSVAAESLLERGRYLVRGIAGCGNCHTPMGPNGPLAGKELAGGTEFDELPAFKTWSANLTPDKETGLGKWTDKQIATAIREGKRPDGRLIGPFMPVDLYRGISDRDVMAIVAYLRSVPAVRNAVPKPDYRIPLPPNYGPPLGKVAEVPPQDKLAYGRYMAGPLGHCIACHSKPGPNGEPDYDKGLAAGGAKFPGPWGESVAPPITGTALARFSDAELKKIITTGVRPDGSRLKPPMGVSFYAHIRDADLDALVTYLRQLPTR